MKFKFLFLFLSGMLLFSCGEDEPEEEEVCLDLSALLIGVWDSDENPGTTVEFKSNTQIVDDEFIFVDNDFNAGDTVTKVYFITEDDEIDFSYSSGFKFNFKTGAVQEFTCETFKINLNGKVLNFTKR